MIHKIAVLKSSKLNEYRLPFVWQELNTAATELKPNFVFESGYGLLLGVSDESLSRLGFDILPRERLLQNAQFFLILKPTLADLRLVRDGATVLGWIHAMQSPEVIDVAIKKSLTLIALENCFDQLGYHILRKNNHLAGRYGVEHALENFSSLTNKKACVIGYGDVGKGAVSALIEKGFATTVFTRHSDQEKQVVFETYERYGGTLYVQKKPIAELFSEYGVIVNAIKQNMLQPVGFLSKNNEKVFQENTLIIDVSCDPGYGFPFAKVTHFECPVEKIEHVYYYGIDNIPSFKYQKSSQVISKALSNYLMPLLDVVKENTGLFQSAIETLQGIILNKEIIAFQGR